MTDALCVDTSVWIKYLCPDEQNQAAIALVTDALTRKLRFVAPCFAWAEVGSVLRKKVRANLLIMDEAEQLYMAYTNLPIDYIDTETIRTRAWQIAEENNMPTLYDASFLACTESESADFWTADETLLNQLSPRPSYVRQLGVGSRERWGEGVEE